MFFLLGHGSDNRRQEEKGYQRQETPGQGPLQGEAEILVLPGGCLANLLVAQLTFHRNKAVILKPIFIADCSCRTGPGQACQQGNQP